MNDPLKKFIEDNREDFDHLEPAADILQQIKGRLKPAVEEKVQVRKLYPVRKWMIAASVAAAALITTYALQDTVKNNVPTNHITQHVLDKPSGSTIPTPKNDVEPAITLVKNKAVQKSSSHKKNIELNVQPQNEQAPTTLNPDVYAQLTDSSSASTRLAAVLQIEKSDMISYKTIDMLASVVNNDANSNVRLAALNVMGKYVQDEHVSALLVKSLNTQNDPLVQVGLIGMLSKIENDNIDNKLFALVNDPTTFEAVKDEAYITLLNKNKL